jgi:predicted nucleic acid-binding protein
MAFVVDASATLPWCFQDEATPWSEAVLDRLAAGELVSVPAHWLVEVSNGLLMATRRKRIDLPRAEWFLDRLTPLRIIAEPPLSPERAKVILELCIKHGLTFYDATYLELARRSALPLATLDDALLRAAPLEGVSLVA